MSSVLQLKRRIGGSGSPAVAGMQEGELALAFPNAAGANASGDCEIWAFDGTAWVRSNPPAAINVVSKSIPGTTDPASDGNATAAGAGWPWVVVAGQVPIVTHNGSAYAFTGGAGSYGTTSGGTALTSGMFTSLGSATSFATAAEVVAGTLASKAIAPDQLKAAARDVGSATATNDAGYLVRLNGAGKIDTSLLSMQVVHYRGPIDITQPYVVPANLAAGDFAIVQTTGTADTSWNAVGVTGTVSAGHLLMYDGVTKKWQVIENNVDLSGYLPLAGTGAGAMSANAHINWQGDETGTTIIDGKGGSVTDIHWNLGTY